jgi:hypothetical protein
MKARALLIVLVAVGLVLLAIRLHRHTPQTAADNPPTNMVAQAATPTPGSQVDSGRTTATIPQPVPMPGQPQRQNTPDAQGNWASDPLPPGSNLQERLEQLERRRGVPLNVLTQQALAQWSNAMSEAGQEMNRPIDFYGKVVDERDEPLSGANVRFGCVVFPEKHFTTNAITDKHGTFALTGVTGVVLNVIVSKEGYEEIQGTNQNSFAYYAPTGAGFTPDPNNPVFFHLRKKASE